MAASSHWQSDTPPMIRVWQLPGHQLPPPPAPDIQLLSHNWPLGHEPLPVSEDQVNTATEQLYCGHPLLHCSSVPCPVTEKYLSDIWWHRSPLTNTWDQDTFNNTDAQLFCSIQQTKRWNYSIHNNRSSAEPCKILNQIFCVGLTNLLWLQLMWFEARLPPLSCIHLLRVDTRNLPS